MPQHHLRTCPLCEAMCGLKLTVDQGRVLSVRGDPDDVLSGGHICPKAAGLVAVDADPDRLRTPQKRVGDTWHSIGWDEALDEAAERLQAVQQAHGPNSLGVYLGNPNVHNFGAVAYGLPLLRALGTRSRYSATSLDQLPQMFAAHQVLGHQLLLPVPDLDRTELFVMLGANPLVSNGSLMSAGDVGKRLEAIQARGGRIVVVDPARTQTARLADVHLPIRPGTDALLLLALLHQVFAADAVDLGHLAAHTDGIDAVARIAAEWPPARVAEATGLEASAIVALAAELIRADRAAIYARMGASTQLYGGLSSWLVLVLNAVTGNLDAPGGMMLPEPAVDLRGLVGRGSHGRRKSRVRGLPSFGGELPSAALGEELDTPGPGQLRGMLTIAGNPVLSAPDGRRIEAGLRGLDAMVSIDIYRNETTRLADLILPPTFGVEHEHYDIAFHNLTVRNTVKYSEPLRERDADQRHDWEISLGLMARWKGGVWRLLPRLPGPLWRQLGPARLLDVLLRLGPYGKGFTPLADGLSLAEVRRHPHGLDLGPLRSILPAALRTPSARVQLAPPACLADLDRLRADLAGELSTGAVTPSRADRPLLLIGRRELKSNNSWMHNAPKLIAGKRRCTLRMHPDDAAAGGLADGQQVRLESDVGSILVELEVHDALRRGVVSLPHGWGHGRQGTQLRVAAGRPGASANDVTDPARVDVLTGNAALNGVPVAVSAP